MNWCATLIVIGRQRLCVDFGDARDVSCAVDVHAFGANGQSDEIRLHDKSVDHGHSASKLIEFSSFDDLTTSNLFFICQNFNTNDSLEDSCLIANDTLDLVV